MIQRIQTLFLAGVAVIGVMLYYLPLYSYSVANEAARHVFSLRENIFLTSLNGFVILLALVAVFLYRNRMIQVRICSLNMLLVSILIVSDFYFSENPVNVDEGLKFESGSYLVLADLLLLWLAIRFIRKDEKLIRSADRLR